MVMKVDEGGFRPDPDLNKVIKDTEKSLKNVNKAYDAIYGESKSKKAFKIIAVILIAVAVCAVIFN